ncbi:MAG: hypothetical protein JRD89_19890 [Deltaproteobacteria bacterium]|nr:hypothetical protein [Deltaproteobacteria bacterium]
MMGNNTLLRILEELEKQKLQQKPKRPTPVQQPKQSKQLLSQTTSSKERVFGDKHSINKIGDSLGQTVINVGDKHLIELLRAVHLRKLPVSSSKNTVKRGNKKYTYIRKRVDLPNDYNEEYAVVFSPSEFLKFVEAVSIAFEKAFGVYFNIEKLKKFLYEEE